MRLTGSGRGQEIVGPEVAAMTSRSWQLMHCWLGDRVVTQLFGAAPDSRYFLPMVDTW